VYRTNGSVGYDFDEAYTVVESLAIKVMVVRSTGDLGC
jgi:hypothetical protein